MSANRINPNNKKHDTVPTSEGYHSFDHVPTFTVGSQSFVGEQNRYDKIASEKGIRCVDTALYPICSGRSKITVDNIIKGWKPKESAHIFSWLSNKDYSDDSNFEPEWIVSCEKTDLLYELADFLEAINNNQ